MMEQQICLQKFKNDNFDDLEVTSRLLNIIFDMPVDQQLNLLDKLDKSGYQGARRHARMNLKNPWAVLIDSEREKATYNYFINNISRCGMFIKTDRGFKEGERITMRFQVPSSQKLYQIIGEIVRFQENGIGIKFKRQVSEK